MSACTTPEQALAFVREHGVVLASAKGSAPRLTEAIAGETIRGSWWSHAQGRHIDAVLGAVSESEQLTQVHEQHTPSGRHASVEVPFPQWVPPDVLEQGACSDENQALAVFGAWLAPCATAGKSMKPV